MRCFVSLGRALLWFAALQCVWAFCEKSKRAVCACELSPCFCFTSVFSLFEKVGGLKGVGFFQSHEGYTLHLRGCGSSHRLCSGNVSRKGKKKRIDGSDGGVRSWCFSLRSINY